MQASGAQEVSRLPHPCEALTPPSSCRTTLSSLQIRAAHPPPPFPSAPSIHPAPKPLTFLGTLTNDPSFLPSQIALETEFDNAPALALYTSLGFVPEKRLHRFYLNGKDAFRLVLPLALAEDAVSAPHKLLSGSSSASSSSSSLLPVPEESAEDAVAAAVTGDDDLSSDCSEDTAKLVRLRRRVAALRECRMITVWPADDDDRVSGR